MLNHYFDVDIATQFGIEESILLCNIRFWIEKNKANDKGYHDGNWWTYNSVKAFNELFPYMTPHVISRALQHLEQAGIIITGNYNKSTYDRTKWYAITEIGWALFGESIPKKAEMEDQKNVIPFSKNDKPIPDNKPIIKKDSKQDKGLKTYVEETIDDEDYRDALFSFIDHRREIKAPMTLRALQMLIRKLEKVASNIEDRQAILERSILNGWKGIYPPDEKQTSNYSADYSAAYVGLGA